jgi:transposase
MEKKEKYQFSFSTYEAYKKIRKNDPLKLVFESINWSFINPMVEGHYRNNKELVYSPLSLFKAQLLIYLGEAKSNRDLAERLRFNTKYCVLCGFHQFLKTPAHSTFSSFRKKVGPDLFHKVMHRIIAQSVPVIIRKFPDLSPKYLHIVVYSKDGKWIKCNCKGKCKFNSNILVNFKKVRKKNFVSSGYKIKLFIDKDSCKPFAAEMRPK